MSEGCLPQILHGPLLNTLSRIIFGRSEIYRLQEYAPYLNFSVTMYF